MQARATAAWHQREPGEPSVAVAANFFAPGAIVVASGSGVTRVQ